MQPEITIHDHPWGSGMTTEMIENLQEDRKYLVILPLLSEVDRIVETATKVHFSQPSENDNEAGTMEASLEEMLLAGQNIATTRSLHQRLVPMARRGLLDVLFRLHLGVQPRWLCATRCKLMNVWR